MHPQLVDLDFSCSKLIMRKSYIMIQQQQISRNLQAHYRSHIKMMMTTKIYHLTLPLWGTPLSGTLPKMLQVLGQCTKDLLRHATSM
jgi:hypothetical protein